MATDSGQTGNDDSLYPIAVLIDELRNDELQVSQPSSLVCECCSAFFLCACVFVFVAVPLRSGGARPNDARSLARLISRSSKHSESLQFGSNQPVGHTVRGEPVANARSVY